MNRSTGFIARHPRLTTLGVLLVGAVAVLGLFEVGLRLFGSINIQYYTGTKTPGLHRYPYGDIPINAQGFPDEEFNTAGAKKRIGYVGDSVTYGMGAGYGYRIPDLLERTFPQYDHWVFAGVGERLEQPTLITNVRRFGLDSVIYLMNLNDIVPDLGQPDASTWAFTARGSWLGSLDDALRGRSYLYTHMRFGLKNAFERLGYEHHGMAAFELAPTEHAAVIDATARRVAAALSAAVTARDGQLRTCVVVLPYEMQVSADAARTYRDLGFSWEAGFESGSTQSRLVPALEALGLSVFDAREAFAGKDLKVGDVFVYNKGDRTDWNHPNRTGHQLLASWLERRPDFAPRCFGPGL